MKIQEYITKHKLTYRSFAERIGLAHATIFHFLSGRNKTLSLSTVQKIVKGTKGEITLQDLMEENEKGHE